MVAGGGRNNAGPGGWAPGQGLKLPINKMGRPPSPLGPISTAKLAESLTAINKADWARLYCADLIWPNSEPSGITPLMLSTRPVFKEVMARGGAAQSNRPVTFCDKALRPIKRQRPETLPKNVLLIRSDPPTVDIDDAEEFLVHDPLFVEFFNAFLALPAFPEPVCFNVDTGGFEVVSDGRQRLAKQIKEAVRSQNFTPKIYRLARQHAFSNMPLIPIEDTEGPEGVKIDTTYNVTVLNKDQGIYWIKAERLPVFLESDFYFQYRLAKVISQARLFNEKKDFVIMKIDFTPRQKKVKKAVEVPPPNVEDMIVKKMYVSFGDVKGAAKEAWFTQAKDGISTNPKFTTLTPKMSSEVLKSDYEQRKQPKSSVFRSPYFGVYAPGLVGPGESEPPIDDDDVLNNDMFRKIDDRPFTPRPGDKIHRSTRSARKTISGTEGMEQMVKPGSVVYVLPKQDNQSTDTDSAIGEIDVQEDEELEKRMNMQPIIDDIYNDDSWDVSSSIALKSISEFGSVIVGAVLKKTLADVLSVTEEDILQDPKIKRIYPSTELSCITVSDLDKCYVDRRADDYDEEMHGKTISIQSTHSAGSGRSKKSIDTRSTVSQPTTHNSHWNREIKKSAEEESDADSLLDSDEDFEEQDIYFRRKKDKWYNLTSMKGIMNFKKFLSGTPGEKYWELWMDIDKGRLISEEEEEANYSTYLRGKYHKQGSPFELSKEDKIKLGLEGPSAWHKEHLLQIQGIVMEPLVLYWAPRYLLKHLLQTDPDKYYMYSAMKSFQPPRESHPDPKTKSLLPLRPKSCCPRTRQGPRIEEMSAMKNRINQLKANEAEFITTPKVGNRRSYGEDTIKRLANTPTAKYFGIKPPAEPKPPKPKAGGDFARPPTASSSSTTKSKRRASITPSTIRPDGNEKQERGNSFVGKLPGLGTNNKRKLSVAESGTPLERCKCKSEVQVTIADNVRRKSDVDEEQITFEVPARTDIPCPTKNLKTILGEDYMEQTASGEALGPIKKPRDLLSPKLRILDTKQQRSRQSSAVRRSESRESEKVTFYRQDSMESSKTCDSRPASGSRHGGGMPNKMADMTDCAFMGSERMEMLLQALHHDQEAGRAFRKFMEKDEESNVALNCFEFWDNVQEYRKLFYKDKLDLFFINKQAKVIFAQFIVNGSPKSIEVSDSIELIVMDRLIPAYEDLYDEAEEHALKVLFAEFLEFLSQDVKTYCKVERSEISRRLETKNTYILNLQKKGIIKERPLTPEGPQDDYVDPVYDESILEKIPEEFRDWTFETLVNNRLELEHFRQYLIENYAEIDLKCWVDIEAWRRTPPNEGKKRDQRARDIKKLYLNKKYFFGPSSPASRAGQNKVMEAAGGWGKFLDDKPHHAAILASQKYVAERLEKKHLPLFLTSKGFQSRHWINISEEDVRDDMTIQKKRRSQAIFKVRSQALSIFDKISKRLTAAQRTQEANQIRSAHSKGGLLRFSSFLGHDSRHESGSSSKSGSGSNDEGGSQDASIAGTDVQEQGTGSIVIEAVKTLSGASGFDATRVSNVQGDDKSGTVLSGEATYAEDEFENIAPTVDATIIPEPEAKTDPPKKKGKKKKAAAPPPGSPPAPKKGNEAVKPAASKHKQSQIIARKSRVVHDDEEEIRLSGSSYGSASLMESKWLHTTKEIYLFKTAIKNVVILRQFQKYVAVQGEFLENDLLFWLEVNRYKEMHHNHTEDSMLQSKINAIVQCFIDSSIPPSVQIDIPMDMVDRILDHKHEKGPYLFREAQLAIFRILLNHWIPFCEFRNNMGTEAKVLKTLDRHRHLATQKEAKYLEELEKEKQKKEAEEAALNELLPDEIEDEDKAKIAFSYSGYLSNEKLAQAEAEGQRTFEEDGTQTIRSMFDKSVDTSDSDEKLFSKGEELLMNNRRLSTTSDKRRSSELSGIGKGKCSSPEERAEQVNRLLS